MVFPYFLWKYEFSVDYSHRTVLTLRLLAVLFGLGRTLKKESSRPWVVPVRALLSFLAPFLTLSSLNALSPHKYLTRPSSSGSDHFS
jgi:hypothetical protein